LDPLKNFNQVESFHHILIRATTDCYDRTIKWDEMRFYGDGDSLLESGDVSGDAESVEPESFTEDLLKFVCSRQRAVKGEQGPHSRDLYLR
jgi:hypothetical protein